MINYVKRQRRENSLHALQTTHRNCYGVQRLNFIGTFEGLFSFYSVRLKNGKQYVCQAIFWNSALWGRMAPLYPLMLTTQSYFTSISWLVHLVVDIDEPDPANNRTPLLSVIAWLIYKSLQKTPMEEGVYILHLKPDCRVPNLDGDGKGISGLSLITWLRRPLISTWLV